MMACIFDIDSLFGSPKKRMLFTEAIGRKSQLNEFLELESFKMAAEVLIKYLQYIYQPKINTEHEQSYQQVNKHEYLHMTTKTNFK